MQCSANGTSDKDKNIMKAPEGGFGVAKVFLCPAGTLLDLQTIDFPMIVKSRILCPKYTLFLRSLMLKELLQDTNINMARKVKIDIGVTFLIICAFITSLASLVLGGVDILLNNQNFIINFEISNFQSYYGSIIHLEPLEDLAESRPSLSSPSRPENCVTVRSNENLQEHDISVNT